MTRSWQVNPVLARKHYIDLLKSFFGNWFIWLRKQFFFLLIFPRLKFECKLLFVILCQLQFFFTSSLLSQVLHHVKKRRQIWWLNHFLKLEFCILVNLKADIFLASSSLVSLSCVDFCCWSFSLHVLLCFSSLRFSLILPVLMSGSRLAFCSLAASEGIFFLLTLFLFLAPLSCFVHFPFLRLKLQRWVVHNQTRTRFL